MLCALHMYYLTVVSRMLYTPRIVCGSRSVLVAVFHIVLSSKSVFLVSFGDLIIFCYTEQSVAKELIKPKANELKYIYAQ